MFVRVRGNWVRGITHALTVQGAGAAARCTFHSLTKSRAALHSVYESLMCVRDGPMLNRWNSQWPQ